MAGRGRRTDEGGGSSRVGHEAARQRRRAWEAGAGGNGRSWQRGSNDGEVVGRQKMKHGRKRRRKEKKAHGMGHGPLRCGGVRSTFGSPRVGD